MLGARSSEPKYDSVVPGQKSAQMGLFVPPSIDGKYLAPMLRDELKRDLWVIDVLLLSVPLNRPPDEKRLQILDRHVVYGLKLNAVIHCKHPIDFAILCNDRWIHMMMGGKAFDFIDIQGLDFVLPSRFIEGIISFPVLEQLESCHES
jgi:hypothetical protein